jgi:hypothetical protein
MNRSTLFACAAAVTLLFAGGSPRAAEKDEKKEEAPEKALKRAEVPKPVIEAVTKKYPKAKLKKFGEEMEEGKKIFEVELTSGTDQVSVDVSPEGKILAEETVVKPSALPAPVKAALEGSKYKGWKVAKAEKVIHEEKEGTLEYEVLVQSKKERYEVVLDKDGKITKEEAKSAKDVD